MAGRSSLVRLNCSLIVNKLQSEGYYRWWVAERVGVHKTTLRRWLNGGIDRVTSRHAEMLAEALELPVESVCLQS